MRKMTRDFTYIDDIVESIMRLIKKPPSPDEWEALIPLILKQIRVGHLIGYLILATLES